MRVSSASNFEPVYQFHEIFYGRYDTRGYPNLKLFNCLHLVLTTWRMREIRGGSDRFNENESSYM
jgi:hypothetical protein